MLNILDYDTMGIKKRMLSKRERYPVLFLIFFIFPFIPYKLGFPH
jgi:hypothetical protein